jgi:hypothetical protein
MTYLTEWHVYISSAPNWRKNTTETFKVFKVAFGEQVMGRTHLYEWL